jgi:hypothetical protein
MTLRQYIPSRAVRRAVLTGSVIALALPAVANATTPRGTVLLVNKHQHVIELVSSRHSVHGYAYVGNLSNVHFGSRVAYRSTRGFVHVITVQRRRAKQVTFVARVVASGGSGLVLRLVDGMLLAFAPSALPSSSSTLTPGHTVLVTERLSRGKVRLTFGADAGSAGVGGSGRHPTSGSGSGASGGSSCCIPTGAESSGTEGIVVRMDSDHIVLQLTNGSSLTAQLPAAGLGYLSDSNDLGPCEVIDFDYHQGPQGPVIDSFMPTGMSTSASISVPANQDTCADENGGSVDAVGTISQLSASSVTISVPGAGPLTIPLDPGQALNYGNSVGDIVDVTFSQNPNGSLSGSSIAPTEEYTTGTVTAVNSNTLAIKDAITGQTDTFAPNDATFGPVSRGDVVAVAYYVASGQLEADNVSDLTTGTNS